MPVKCLETILISVHLCSSQYILIGFMPCACFTTNIICSDCENYVKSYMFLEVYPGDWVSLWQ